ncbi:histidine kinase [uncultured Sphaerochaeta sp.]|uniref:cache domain-containing sensor histidine kinase n=1 Tax=uncultured Sphaerochaeta sp. TaxID=886478 RepID=UPI002A0A45E0|nr:histidine kinase [uncultured Sphaerochaeta sp.]
MKNRTFSIRTGYITLFIIIIVITASIAGITFYRVMDMRAFSRVQRDDSWLVSQLCKSATYLSQQAGNVSSALAFDSDIQSILISYEYNSGAKPDIAEIQTKINNSLVDKGRFNKAIYDCRNIILFSNNGTVLGSKETFDMNINLYSYPWVEQVVKSTGKEIWLPLSLDENSSATKNILSIPVVRKVFSTQSSATNTLEENLTVGKSLGYLLVYFDNSMFSDIVSQYSRTTKRFYLIDSNDIIISAPETTDIGTKFLFDPLASGYVQFNGEEYLMTKMQIEGRGWSYICLTYRTEVERDGSLILSVCLFLSVFLIAAFTLLGMILSRYTTKPIYFLISCFKEAESGKVKIEDHSNIKEFNDLYDSFNYTMDRIHDLANEVYLSKLEKQELAISIKESRIQSLQNQINPHFLYNTLDSINWRAQMDNNKEVSEMICKLGKFFRSNISISGNEIPLWKEIENTKLYVALSQYHFGNNLQYEVISDVDPKKVLILRLLLQPLIENSIKHGIEQTGQKEHISIHITQENKFLQIAVKDDGPGMDTDTLCYLRQLWKKAGLEYQKETRSIGLYNVFRRLSLTYYGNATLSIVSEINLGTEFVISIPLNISEEILTNPTTV